jgi:replication-associated recombination protein RarA
LNDKEIKKRIENKIGGTNKNKKNKKECKTLVESSIIEVLADAKSRGDARFTATIIEYYREHKQKSKWFTYIRREYLLLGCKIYANQITLYSLYARLSSFLGSYKTNFTPFFTYK